MIFRAKPFTYCLFFIVLANSIFTIRVAAQDAVLWHNKERTLHYKPSGKDFVLYQGTRKFNRALYGTNTAFRVETGDLPEFAMYMPGMGGNCKIGIVTGNQSKWITEAEVINTIYRPGSMLYDIKDKLLQNGSLHITALAMANEEGMILKIENNNTPANLKLVIAYGGASGKKFSRDGDVGADPESSFYLQPGYCKDNQYRISKNSFRLYYGFTKPLSDDDRYEIQYGKAPDSTQKDKPKLISGLFPANSILKIADANQQATPLQLLKSTASQSAPVITASIDVSGNNSNYFLLQKDQVTTDYKNITSIFTKAEQARKAIADRIIVETPDEYINTIGGALSIAADGIWESPTYMHGAVAWRMRLPAWRGPYAADALGWHDRARTHFDSYLKSQVTNIAPGAVVPDSALHFARQLEKMGTAMFSNGYICRNPDGKIQPHHYDMNLVFIDQLLTHFNYTGDINFIKKVWPNLRLHLQWEKRNFDADGDGLYDAYAVIWASDALQYSGGGVTHSSAYNYRANKMAAQIAKILGEDGSAYEAEANKILNAMNQKLWLKDKGRFAENVDIMGLQLAHTSPGLWTIYHAIDEGTATPEQKYQMLRYVDNDIPHIPVRAKGLDIDNLYVLSTTNWQPYTWSVNNVALAENLHTSLAYWQSGENENAFQLWKSALIESMYMSSGPGNFAQLSFYDAVRGDLYRDFADPIGMAARTLMEGLFGVHPDALNNKLVVQPGFPASWNFAKLKTPDISIAFKQYNNTSTYTIAQHYSKTLPLILQLKALKDNVKTILVNGKKVDFHWVNNQMNYPAIAISAGAETNYTITIEWDGNAIENIPSNIAAVENIAQTISLQKAKAQSAKDANATILNENTIQIKSPKDNKYTAFVNLRQSDANWIAPIYINTKPTVEIKIKTINPDNVSLNVINNTNELKPGTLLINNYSTKIQVQGKSEQIINIPANNITKGTNIVKINWNNGQSTTEKIIDWNAATANNPYEAVNLVPYFNDNVVNTFKHQYLSPRPKGTTLQIPWQGIGNWCYPLADAEMSDAGIKGKENIHLNKISFALGSDKNIIYTSQWDNFPNTINIPLSGKSGHAWLLMAGTTNHQQSQMTNGIVYIEYKDGTKDSLPLINPENWWPIEQDYINDGFAFKSGPKPYRLVFKTGELTRDFNKYSSIKGLTNMGIDGGAGTVLDLPLDKNKELKSLTLTTLTNEVVIGLMSLTLQR